MADDVRGELAAALGVHMSLIDDRTGTPPEIVWHIACTCGWDGGRVLKATGRMEGARERWRLHVADALLTVVDRIAGKRAAEAEATVQRVKALVTFYDRHEYSTLNVDDLRAALDPS